MRRISDEKIIRARSLLTKSFVKKRPSCIGRCGALALLVETSLHNIMWYESTASPHCSRTNFTPLSSLLTKSAFTPFAISTRSASISLLPATVWILVSCQPSSPQSNAAKIELLNRYGFRLLYTAVPIKNPNEISTRSRGTTSHPH
jgi:hypothetical protein